MSIKVPTKNPNSKLLKACGDENLFIKIADVKENIAVNKVALILAKWIFLGKMKAANHINNQMSRIGIDMTSEPPPAVARPLPPLKFIQGEKQWANTAAFSAIIRKINSFPIRILTDTTLTKPFSKSMIKTESPIHFDFDTLNEFKVPTFPEPADLISISL